MVGCWEWLKSDTINDIMTREVLNYEKTVGERTRAYKEEMDERKPLGVFLGGTRKKKPISLRRTRRR